MDFDYANNYGCGYLYEVESPISIVGRNISNMAIAGRERLYPAGTRFKVANVTKAGDKTKINLVEM